MSIFSVFNERSASPAMAVHNTWHSGVSDQPVAMGADNAVATVDAIEQDNDPHPLGIIYDEVLDSIQRVCDFVDANPDVAPDTMTDFNQQLVSIIECVDAIGEADYGLDYARQTLDWELNNAGHVYNSFHELYKSQCE